jgi:hypothetical protein
MLARDGLMGGREWGKSSFGDGPLHGEMTPRGVARTLAQDQGRHKQTP